jgi:hypothetical protein
LEGQILGEVIHHFGGKFFGKFLGGTGLKNAAKIGSEI